jgi:hypothetical protein
MKSSGKILKNSEGQHLLVFSHVEPDEEKFEIYPSYIGYNLTTERVDEYRPKGYVVSACLSELTNEEQTVLAKVIPARQALAARTVAITAKARSGKDHTANVIKTQYPLSSTIRAFAEPIREIAFALYGEVKGKNREALIMIGQGLRKEDPNIWIKVWLRRNIELYLKTKGDSDKFICQDLRQPNEYQFFKNLGATIVRIDTDQELRLAKLVEMDGEEALDTKLLTDETERNAGEYEVDYVLVNNYDDSFDKSIVDFVRETLVEQKGW